MIAKLIATAGGVGYCPWAPGTAGSLIGWLLGYAAAWYQPPIVRLVTLGVACLIAVAASGAAERQLKQHDPAAVVIDEVVGMWMVFALLPRLAESLWMGLMAFALFRAFDVVKPPPLKWLARAPGGWGIVLDDLGASCYTAAILFFLNHSITQSLNHSITQSLNLSISQSLNLSITQSLNLSITQSLNHSITQSLNLLITSSCEPSSPSNCRTRCRPRCARCSRSSPRRRWM